MTHRSLMQKVKHQFKALGGKCIPGGIQEVGTPDIIGCIGGEFIAIECKVGRDKPRPIQVQRMKEWQDAGAVVYVTREDFDLTELW